MTLEADREVDASPGIGTAAAAVAVSEAAVGDQVSKEWPEGEGVWGFITTVDHKRIGRRYMATAALFFTLSGLDALVMRLQLAQPESGLVSPAEYNQLFTLHGVVMIFFFSTPMLFGFGNFLVPLMLGTRDMAYPRMNAFGYWVFLFSGLFMFSSLAFGAAPNGGWFAYVPLTRDQFSPGLNLDVYCLGLLFLGVSTTVGAINFIVTALKFRAPGMTLARVPVYVWSIVVTSFLVVFALPPLNLANLMLFLDRRFHTNFFDTKAGGDVILWQHLFWIFGHPDVYIIVLPALGIVSSIIPTFSRRPIAAYSLVVLATVATGLISFGVWVHHMFAVGLPQLSLSFFSAASTLVTIPSGIQMFAWLYTMLKGRVVITTPLVYVFGFFITFVMGGVTGVMFAIVPFDQQTTDSYFVVAHFHYVLFGGAVFPIMAGLFYWWPKFTGRHTNERAGRVSALVVLVGFHLTFLPMHVAGLFGMPRRIYTYEPDLGWTTLNLIETIGAFILAAGLVGTASTLLVSLVRGEEAEPDPWGGETLEWATTSPPRTHNFAVLPTVHSLHPLWDRASLASFGTGTADEDRVVSDGHSTLMTSELDAEPEHPVEMPEDTPKPFVVAVFMLLTTIFTLLSWWVAAIIAGAGIALSLLWWLWPVDEAAPEESTSTPQTVLSESAR